jgi:adenylate cyclase
MSAPNFVLAKAIVLLLCGVVAGLVALQLRRRISRVFRALQERERVVSAFGQQVSPQIVEELLKQGPEIASRRSFVCVMFMDIRGFTPLVEHRTPEEIVTLQNEVFGAAVEVVNRHHGVINQFLGDGFMATFGAPLSTGNDCANALAAARELVTKIKVRVGIGLHAGDAVTGNIGSAERKQYSVTGNVVILASRIEQLNKEFDSQLLVSREVLERCADHGATPLGAVHVKGREQPIEIYKVA